MTDAKNSEDKRATWRIINTAFGKHKKKVYPKSMKTGDSTNPVTDCPKNMANILNNHFVNVAKKLAKKLKKSNRKHTDFMGAKNKSTMFLKPIELQEILEEIKKLWDTK